MTLVQRTLITDCQLHWYSERSSRTVNDTGTTNAHHGLLMTLVLLISVPFEHVCSFRVLCCVPYSFRRLSIHALAACIMERWYSYYHQNYYDGYPGTYSGASHVRYPFSVDQWENETPSLANRHYSRIFTSATGLFLS